MPLPEDMGYYIKIAVLTFYDPEVSKTTQVTATAFGYPL